ncbi:MAG: hypothetical protein Ct9H300mP21_09050 [Pseudomonadota bacterium]|nr:MAG: hypothetical protein Ct9H300mP21_09050 [Pseudomonadota bacterium]
MNIRSNPEFSIQECTGFWWGQDGVKKGVFKHDQRNLAEIGSTEKKPLKY